MSTVLDSGRCPVSTVLDSGLCGVLNFHMLPGIARRGKRKHGAQIKTDSPKRARDVFSPKVKPCSQTGLKSVRIAHSAF